MPKKKPAKAKPKVEQTKEKTEANLSAEAQQALADFRQAVFEGVRWSGWRYNRDGNEEADLAIIYSLEPAKPLGYTKEIVVSSVLSDEQKRTALRDAVVEMVEEFVGHNLGAPQVEITSSQDLAVFNEGAKTKAGKVADALAEPAEAPPDVQVEDTNDIPEAFSELHREQIRAEVFTQEFGTPEPTYPDVAKDVLRRRF